MAPHFRITSQVLQFLKDQVLTISEITRTSKLTEILESYAKKTNDQVYVIQNSRNKEAQAILSDVEYFQELLMYKEAVEEAIDEEMYQIVLERQDDIADIPMAEVIEQLGLDVDRIIALSDDAEEEE